MEVGLEDFVFFLLYLDTRVVRRQHQVNFAAQRVHARHPIESGIHTLFETVLGVLLELQMHLIQNVLQVQRQHVLRQQPFDFDCQVHLREVEEAYGAVLGRRQWP